MRIGRVACPACQASIATELLGDTDFHLCPSCSTSLQVRLFPAFTRELPAVATETPLVEGQSTCFYHPQKVAVIPCDSCGRFLCSLCDIEISGHHRCPSCLESGKRRDEVDILQAEHTRYDRIALALTTLTLFFWPLTFLTAPAALFIVIRFWNRRSKILPGTRLIFVVAGLLALAEIAGWIVFIYFLIHSAPPKHARHP